MATYPVEQIRENYLALSQCCYLNTGTVGVMSESVLSEHLARIADYERYGHAGEPHARAGYERARSALADLINAAPNEIALTRNASDGINYVLAGLAIPAGSTIITTTEEHPAVLLPLSLVQQSLDGSIGMLDIAGSDDVILEQLRVMLETGTVSLAIFSHVSCETGKRLPVEEMCALCRRHGVWTLVDGAQSVGQFEVDVNAIGCDFMTGNGHKCVCTEFSRLCRGV